ncbi:odorant receptor 43b-like [Myzus persicae]|uniref:odorant receptor 43b-like n=1 Tax=Myzus persicae TaxID=13164 RepID=UPI000B936CA0|nr:odorant receptor 43b-like [Myzus persicae]UMT69217.1 odorant receptor 10 [Myzus persicae]
MAHTVADLFLRNMGWSEKHGYYTMCMVFFTYSELALTLLFIISTCLSIVYSRENLSMHLHGLLWLLVEIHVFAVTANRLYHKSKLRDMHQRSQKVRIPENYRRTIANVLTYHMSLPNVLVAIPALYMILLDGVQMGDPFTFPFVDVLPIKTTSVTVYVCKYIVYAMPVYIGQLETCFLNVSFMYYTGVVKRHFQILEEQVAEAMVNKDEQKLKIAIKSHQEVLKYFKDMKTVSEIPILVNIEFCSFYVCLTCCYVIQAMQGFINQMILGIIIHTSIAGITTITIYCIYASNMYDLHNGILNALFEHRSCYSRNKSFTQLILLMKTKATILLEFKAGFIFTLNLNLLVKIFRFAYTVFNVLLTSTNRQFKESAI